LFLQALFLKTEHLDAAGGAQQKRNIFFQHIHILTTCGNVDTQSHEHVKPERTSAPRRTQAEHLFQLRLHMANHIIHVYTNMTQ
jgi:hypothetical protein